MMPLPPSKPDDPRMPPPPEYITDDERISRVAPTRPYSDVKTSLETAFQDAVNGIHLPPSKRYFQGKSFARGGIQLLHRKFPGDMELKDDLEDIHDELDKIKPPHPSYSAGISQSMRVLEVKSPRPDASVDSPPENLAPGLVGRMEERDYAEALDQVLDIVWEVAHLLVDRKLLQYEMEELTVEKDDEDADNTDETY